MMMQGTSTDDPAYRVGDWIAACALLILTLPLMILVAVAIKCDSRGPILVRRPRVAAGGTTSHSSFDPPRMTMSLVARPVSDSLSDIRISKTFPSSTMYFAAR